MNATLRRQIERAMRVRDFLRAHKTEGVAEAAGVTRLEELLTRAEVLAGQQMSGLIAARAATAQRERVRDALNAKLLRFLAGVAAVARKESAELAAQFRLPQHRVPNQALVTMARGMLEHATAQKDLLLARGMSETLLAEIAAAVAEFETKREATRTGRRDHVGASADLDAIASEIGEQVRLLDGLVRYRFGDNAELMGAWASARNVVGPFRSHAEATTPGEVPGVEPGAVAPAVVKPAA
jgi:hypothetical protein